MYLAAHGPYRHSRSGVACERKLRGAFHDEAAVEKSSPELFGTKRGLRKAPECGSTTSPAKNRALGRSDVTVASSKRAVRRLDATRVGSRKAPGSFLTTRVGWFGAADRSYAGSRVQRPWGRYQNGRHPQPAAIFVVWKSDAGIGRASPTPSASGGRRDASRRPSHGRGRCA